MKVFFRNIHLYLSLACGLVIAIVCFTGATLVFEKEFQQLIYPERYRVAAGSGVPVPLEQMVKAVGQKEAKAQISAVKIYADPARTVEISYRKEEQSREGRGEGGRKEKRPENREGRQGPAGGPGKAGGEHGGKGGPPRGGEGGKGGGSQAFVNPYTGQVVA